MGNRSLPKIVRDHLGPCRQPETMVEHIVEQCGLEKFMGQSFTDNDPLVFVMDLVAEEVRDLDFKIESPVGRIVWQEAMKQLQAGEGYLEHNTYLPCRLCDQAFEPVVNNRLFERFLPWHQTGTYEYLLQLHQCEACGGDVAAEKVVNYKGDMHTPSPHSIDDDDDWCDALLYYHG